MPSLALGDHCLSWRTIVTVLFALISASLILVSSDNQGINLSANQLKVKEHVDEQSEIIEHLLEGYDKRLIPAVNGKPIKIDLQIKIADVFILDDSKMESEMVLFIRQRWFDYRLSHNYSAGRIKVREHLLDKIWLPDLRMSNLKDLKRFDGFGGVNMNIHRSGEIYFSQLAVVKINCPMDLHTFPMDKQTCFLNFSSYAYARSLMFFLLAKKKVSVKPVYLPQFDFVEAKKIPDANKTTVSRVTVAITFKRRWGYYFLQIYIPSIFLVALSWLAFLMETSDIADRLALDVTMILSIVFLLGSINTSLPHVSYPKASDWFIVVSFGFIFMALLETMLVYRLTSLKTTSSRSQNQCNVLKRFRKSCSDFSCALKMGNMTENGHPQNACGCSDDDSSGPEKHSRKPTGPIQAAEPKPLRLAFWVDKICLIAFPVSYAVFNIFYWDYYM